MTSPESSKPLRTDIAWSDAGGVYVHGYSLCADLLGRVNFGDMAFLTLYGRLPTTGESRMFNALLVTGVEHGIVPSTLAARMTYAGAPESLQGAVAAGLLGVGSVFAGSSEGVGRMLTEALSSGHPQDAAETFDLATRVVEDCKVRGQLIPGVGHPVHKPVDPRTVRLFEIARECGFRGAYVALMEAIAEVATISLAKPLPVNASGAVGALCCELGLTTRVSRGLGIMARAVGLVGHILEESRQPMAFELWHRAEDEATSHLR